MNISNKLTELKARKYGDDFTRGEMFESFTGKVADQLLYIGEAMKAVDRSYTANTYTACERVQNQLRNNISSDHSGIIFEYQGSVPLNMHIRRHSDVDMLVVTGRYHWIIPPLVPDYPYSGDAKMDLVELRSDIVKTIGKTFPEVLINNVGGKAVSISGGSLNRKIDLVPISWVHNIRSKDSADLTHRGIKLYDKKLLHYIENYPFLHIYLCDSKDNYVNGRYRRIVRYIKNVIKDSDKGISISSYDATALMYHMDNFELNQIINTPASLSNYTEVFLRYVITNTHFQQTVKVPNETRLLFSSDGLNIAEVVKLYKEICELNEGVINSYQSLDYYRRQSFDQYLEKA